MPDEHLSRFRHTHDYAPDRGAAERNTRRVIALTAAMMVVEILAGWKFQSMALLADGWHMGTHVAAFLITATAYAMARRLKQDQSFSFGTGKVDVLGGYTSAIILGIVAVLMAGESVIRFFRPLQIHYNESIAIGLVGLCVNIASALLLKHDHGPGHSHGHDHQHGKGGEDLNLKAENLTTLYIGYIRRLSPHFQAELALAIPPVAKTEGVGPATLGSVPYAGQVISTARWIAPTAFIEYNFFDEGTKFRPFIGVGINYTTFYDRDSTAAGNAASGGPTRLSLTSSTGPAATAGFTYKIAPHWDATASYSIARVNSNLEADTAGLIRTTSIKFGPQALILSIGYSF